MTCVRWLKAVILVTLVAMATAMAVNGSSSERFFVPPEEQEAYALRLFHRFPAPQKQKQPFPTDVAEIHSIGNGA